MLSKCIQYQGKAGFLIEDISRNTGKCELGGFSLRQSQIISYTKTTLKYS